MTSMSQTDWEAFGRRLMDRVERDGNGLHLSSIVDEGVAFEATRNHIAPFFSRWRGSLDRRAFYDGQVVSAPGPLSGGGGGGNMIFGIDLARSVDRTVIRCGECGNDYMFLASEKMPAACHCCGAPFEGKERT